MPTENSNQQHLEIELIESSGEFDVTYYLSKYPDVASSGINPIQHYVYYGAAEGRNPNAKFSTRDYQKKLNLSGAENPFATYLAKKISQNGETIDTLMLDDYEIDPQVLTIYNSGIFDLSFYQQQQPDVDFSASEVFPSPELAAITHYINQPAPAKANPCEQFDNLYYLTTYKDVANSKFNPLVHYLEYGWKEFRIPTKNFDTGWYWLINQSNDKNETCPIVHYINEGIKLGVATKPAGATDLELLDAAVETLIDSGYYEESIFLRAGQYLANHKRIETAERIFDLIIKKNDTSTTAYGAIAKICSDRGFWWRAIEYLESACCIDPEDAEIFFRLGEAYEKMSNYPKARLAYAEAVSLNPEKDIFYYRLGYVNQKLGKTSHAEKAFAKAIETEPKKQAKRFGTGIYDQQREYWKDASEAYKKHLKVNPRDAELHFRLGMAYDRCYEWAKAQYSYEIAISLDPTISYWYYRLAFILERRKEYASAADMYALATQKSNTFMSYWFFRQGYSLHQSKQFEEACKAYIKTRQKATLDAKPDNAANKNLEVSVPDSKTLSHDSYYLSKIYALKQVISNYSNTAEDYYALGEEYERIADWYNAIKSYEHAVIRSNKHRSEWYYRLGYVLYRSKNYEKSAQAFKLSRNLNKAYGVDLSKHKDNAKAQQRMIYSEYLDLPIRQSTILYESFLAASIGCNPLSIFRALLDNKAYEGWLHIWVINDKKNIPDELLFKENVIFIERMSDAYYMHVATASHLINNVTFPDWFIRRKEQKYLNTWHGTPIKYLGTDIRDEFMAHKNVSRNFLHTTHLLSPNVHTSDVMLKKYDINGIYSGRLAETGYPRIDNALKLPDADKQNLFEKLGLVDNRPVVLYAPTWRGIHGAAEVDLDQLKGDISKLSELPYQIVFRGHHLSESAISDLDLPVIVADQSIDTCDLLSIVDVLVTDYSSIFFDFLSLQKPVIFYIYDLEEYTQERGLYFDYDDMPGKSCTTIETLLKTVEDSLSKAYVPDENHLQSIDQFCAMDDGQATRRAIDFFFNDSNEFVTDRYRDDRNSLLFFGGAFIPNGITSSCINLISNIPSDEYQITLIIDPKEVSGYPQRLDKFSQLPDSVHTIARVGQMVMSPEEQWILQRFNTHRTLESAEMWDILKSAYQREYQRLLSVSNFDSIVNFEGYSYFWSSLLALGTPSDVNSVMFMHNDMKSEWETRHSYLSGMFELYAHYDSLVSVSKMMSTINQEKLGKLPKLSLEKFKYCINTISPQEIAERAEHPVDEDLQTWVGDTPFFITLGRLSPEKDQAKLIEAVHKVRDTHKDIKLVILGDGPLRVKLENMISDLGLENNVLLGGLRENPFPILKRSQCFILPSNHEGQPMVLLESMTLGKSIIATDIDGNRGVLEDGYGALVENSVGGLTAGINEFLSGQVAYKTFDADTYLDNAISMFKKTVQTPRNKNINNPFNA